MVFDKETKVSEFVDFITEYQSLFIKPKGTFMFANYILGKSLVYGGSYIIFFTNKEGIEIIKEENLLEKHEKSSKGRCVMRYVSKKRTLK